MNLSIIVPTPDGWPMMRLVDSLERQRMNDSDEIIIIGDVHTRKLPHVEALVRGLGKNYKYFEFDAGRHAFGHPQRNFGITKASGDYLVFIDDDDEFMPNALEEIRKAIDECQRPAPLMFKFVTPWKEILWADRNISVGRIGGHQFVVPNVTQRVGVWTDRYEGDFDFIVDTLSRWPEESLVWRPEIISAARPA